MDIDTLMDTILVTLRNAYELINESNSSQRQQALDIIEYVSDGIVTVVETLLSDEPYNIETLKQALGNIIRGVVNNYHMFSSPLFGNFIPSFLLLVRWIHLNYWDVQNLSELAARAA